MKTDIIIIGGGINGCGIAAEAAERGLSVTLIERSDLAAYTSSSSSKMIHGGLRYLEQNEFSLVRESLQERTILQNIAQNMVRSQRFFLPLTDKRPTWFVRLGLFLYDHLTKIRTDERSTFKTLNQSSLNQKYLKGFEYSDCVTDDSRLVIVNAMKAKQYNANILTYTTIHNIDKVSDEWKITASQHGKIHTLYAKCLINAAGPWVNEVHATYDDTPPAVNISHVKGSHIIVPSIHPTQAFTFQTEDNRVLFAVPYLNNTTLIGTTEEPCALDQSSSWKISEKELDYLINNINQFLLPDYHLTHNSVLVSYAGVRPLIEDGNDARTNTRGYKIVENRDKNTITIYGGKITTYRILAKEVVDKLTRTPSVSHITKLPCNVFKPLQEAKDYPFIPEHIFERWKTTYGSNIQLLLNLYHPSHKLYNNILFETEILYLMKYEFAHRVQDILYGRTKLGYFQSFSKKSLEEIQAFMNYYR